MAARDLSIVFTSLPRFTDISLLYDDGVCRSTFYATDKSLGQRRVVVKGFRCSNEQCQQVITDICELRKLSHQNIATVIELLTIDSSAKAASVQSMNHICLVQELLDIDIRSLLSSCHQLTSRHRRLFAYQLFAALRHAHSAGISHLGLKPANVLISVRDLTLKIADFGICMIKKEVVTDGSEDCWYQAPEQLLKTTELKSAVGFPADIWSGGCLIAEILTGRPLFTGADQMDQLLRMIDAIQLRDDDWTKVLNVMPNKLLKNHPFRPRSPLRSQLVTKCDRQAIHLLELLLTFNTDERITADEAMSNIYFADLRHGDASELHNEWAINYQNEVNKERGVLPTSSPTSRLSVDTSTVVRSASRPNCRSESNDIALHNFLNNHNSPTSESADRIPSPNILDLLQSRESEQVPKRRSEASDSDGEKEVAEISDEKLKEDLEVGNVSVELLRRLRTSLICGDVDLPDILASVRSRISEIAPSLPADDDASVPEVTCSYFGENTDDVSKVTRDFLEFIAKQAEYDDLFRKPAATVGEGDGKSSSDDFNNSKLTVVTSPQDTNEDSNKINTGARISCDKKEKFLDSAAGGPHECSGCSENVPKAVCTKILMERIESEKSAVRSRRRRSGIASPTAGRQYHRNLTSEEFDELYRLPTEHLRKDMPQHVGIERSSRSGISDRNHHRHQRHHSHDSFHTSNGHRHAFTDDDRSLRDVEGGACGGVDYTYCYDDMAMTHHLSTMDASSAATSSLFHRQTDVVCSAGCFLSGRDEWMDVSNVSDLSLARIPMLAVGRDTTSSPESPASPQTAQAGARPKKSHRKHRPL